MDKILTFIINEDKKLLLLRGSPNDPQFKKSFWYVVTGGCEICDKNREETVKREIIEETGLEPLKTIYLNWIFKYISLNKECTEYAYITWVRESEVILNEENIEYRWCEMNEFIEKIDWFGDKGELEKVLKKAIKNEKYFEKEKIEEF